MKREFSCGLGLYVFRTDGRGHWKFLGLRPDSDPVWRDVSGPLLDLLNAEKVEGQKEAPFYVAGHEMGSRPVDESSP